MDGKLPRKINQGWLQQRKNLLRSTAKTTNTGEPNPNYVSVQQEIEAAEKEMAARDEFEAWVKKTHGAQPNAYLSGKHQPGEAFVKKGADGRWSVVGTVADMWEKYRQAVGPTYQPAASSESAPEPAPASVEKQTPPDSSSQGFDWDEYHRKQDWKDDNDDYEPAPAPKPSAAEVDEAGTVRALRSAEESSRKARTWKNGGLKAVAVDLKPVAVFHRFTPSIGRSETFMIGADGKAYHANESDTYEGARVGITPLDLDAEMIAKLKVLADKQAKEHPEWAKYHAS